MDRQCSGSRRGCRGEYDRDRSDRCTRRVGVHSPLPRPPAPFRAAGFLRLSGGQSAEAVERMLVPCSWRERWGWAAGRGDGSSGPTSAAKLREASSRHFPHKTGRYTRHQQVQAAEKPSEVRLLRPTRTHRASTRNHQREMLPRIGRRRSWRRPVAPARSSFRSDLRTTGHRSESRPPNVGNPTTVPPDFSRRDQDIRNAWGTRHRRTRCSAAVGPRRTGDDMSGATCTKFGTELFAVSLRDNRAADRYDTTRSRKVETGTRAWTPRTNEGATSSDERRCQMTYPTSFQDILP